MASTTEIDMDREQNLPTSTTHGAYPWGRAWWCLGGCLCIIAVISYCLLIYFVVVNLIYIAAQIPMFEFESFRVSGLNMTSKSSAINTSIDYEIMMRNPNQKIGLYYDEINVNVKAYGVSLGDGSIPSFYQGHKTTTYFTGNISSEDLMLNSDAIALLANSSTNVPFYATVLTKARLKEGSITLSTSFIEARCDLLVDLTSTSRSQLTYEQCQIKWVF